MKTLYKILVPVLALATLSSCLQKIERQDVLTEDRKNQIAADDPEKVFAATLNGIYTNIQSANYISSSSGLSHCYFGQKGFDFLSSLMGNDMVMTGQYAFSLYHYYLDYWQQTYGPTNDRWSENYDNIAAANTIISAIQEEGSSKLALSYLAQAKAIRGYSYLQLANLYQRSYYVGADGTKWGKGKVYDWSEKPLVPLLTEETQGDQPRSSVKDVYELIVSDLSSAISIFQKIGAEKTPSTQDMDGCVAALYLARTYLNMHEWDKAIDCADLIMANYGMLTSEADILQGFSSSELPDVMFACDITNDNSTVYASFFSQMDMFGDGYAAIGVWRPAFKPFVDRIADTDIRLEWFLSSRSKANTTYALNKQADYQSCKFIGAGRSNLKQGEDGVWTGTGWELGDYIYLRSEEAWYIKAEALAHKNEIAAAKSVLAEAMAARQKGYDLVTNDKAAVIEEINFQKRVEFWGEGIEFLDNRRLNIPVDRLDETWGADNNNHYPGGKIRKEAEDLGVFTYQLPLSEIENNKQLTTDDQNND